MLKKIRLILILMTVLMIQGCANHANFKTPAPSMTSYKVQHSGVLSIGDRRIPLRGIARYVPEAGYLKILILNDMGMKLYAAEMLDTKDGYQVRPVFKSPFSKALPNFEEESMRCVHALFFGADEALPHTQLSIRREGQKASGNIFLDKKTTLENLVKGYKVALTLSSTTITGQE